MSSAGAKRAGAICIKLFVDFIAPRSVLDTHGRPLALGLLVLTTYTISRDNSPFDSLDIQFTDLFRIAVNLLKCGMLVSFFLIKPNFLPQRGWSSEYHLAYAALRLIREFYAAAFPTHRVLEDGHLVEVVDEAGGNLYMLNEFDKDRRPDIADVEGRFVFEIVPPAEAHQAALRIMARRLWV